MNKAGAIILGVGGDNAARSRSRPRAGAGAQPPQPRVLRFPPYSPLFPSTCSSLPLLFGRSNLGVNLPSCVKSIPSSCLTPRIVPPLCRRPHGQGRHGLPGRERLPVHDVREDPEERRRQSAQVLDVGHQGHLREVPVGLQPHADARLLRGRQRLRQRRGQVRPGRLLQAGQARRALRLLLYQDYNMLSLSSGDRPLILYQD